MFWFIFVSYVQYSSSIKSIKREAAASNPIWSYYRTKEPEVKLDVIKQQRNKKQKNELRHQQSKPLRDITAMPGYTVIGKKRSTSRRKHQPLQSPKFKRDQPSVTENFKKEDPVDHFGDAGND